MEAAAADADAVFRLYTACAGDPRTLIVDVRPAKAFKRGHLLQAYCVRASADGGALLDHSGCEYDLPWSQNVWCAAAFPRPRPLRASAVRGAELPAARRAAGG